MTSQNYIFKSGKEWGILSFMFYNVGGFIFFPSATDKTEGYKLLQLDFSCVQVVHTGMRKPASTIPQQRPRDSVLA